MPTHDIDHQALVDHAGAYDHLDDDAEVDHEYPVFVVDAPIPFDHAGNHVLVLSDGTTYVCCTENRPHDDDRRDRIGDLRAAVDDVLAAYDRPGTDCQRARRISPEVARLRVARDRLV